ncbi:MAG: hypothetical protein Q8O25_08710 [Sulfurisoma sp.]|nr:hypothetical protein [Sulfurisoma sp.]
MPAVASQEGAIAIAPAPTLRTFDIILKTANGTSDLGDRRLRFLKTPYLHWPDTQCTYLEEEQVLFSGDVFGCHFCDARLFNDAVGDFRFSFEYYYAHIMRPFRAHVLEALDLIEPLPRAVGLGPQERGGGRTDAADLLPFGLRQHARHGRGGRAGAADPDRRGTGGVPHPRP